MGNTMDMPRKVNEDFPRNLTFDPVNQKYRYRNPITGVRKWVGPDKDEAFEIANKANEAIAEIEKQSRHDVTFRAVVERMKCGWIDEQPWSAAYKKIILFRLKAADTRWGPMVFTAIGRKELREWIKDRSSNGETYNKWRELLIKVWGYAIAEEITDFNEAEAVPKASTSKKLESNRKKRKRLTTEAFWAIHAVAPPYLQIAMEQSLITLQSRQQIVNTRLTDYRDGFLYYIRNKTAADSEMAFIRIEITDEIDQIRRRALNDVASPYLVHRRPDRKDPDKIRKKPHWTYIWPEELGAAFKMARVASGLFDDWLPAERPGFHEIRSLGGRLYRAAGYPEEYIQALMTHTDLKTTEIYLSNPDKLTTDHYRKVQAGMSLKTAREIKL